MNLAGLDASSILWLNMDDDTRVAPGADIGARWERMIPSGHQILTEDGVTQVWVDPEAPT